MQHLLNQAGSRTYISKELETCVLSTQHSASYRPRMQSNANQQPTCIRPHLSFKLPHERVHFGQTITGKARHYDGVICVWLRNPTCGNITVTAISMFDVRSVSNRDVYRIHFARYSKSNLPDCFDFEDLSLLGNHVKRSVYRF